MLLAAELLVVIDISQWVKYVVNQGLIHAPFRLILELDRFSIETGVMKFAARVHSWVILILNLNLVLKLPHLVDKEL